MGVEELQLIANIISNMGDISVQGLIWFLGYGLLKYVLSTGTIVLFLWLAYRVVSVLVKSRSHNEQLMSISHSLGYDPINKYVGDTDVKRMHKEISKLYEFKGSYREAKEKVSELYGAINGLKDQVDSQERQLIEAARVNQELKDRLKESVSGDTGGTNDEG